MAEKQEKLNWTHGDSPHTFGIWRVNSWIPLAPDHSRLLCDVSATREGWSGRENVFYKYAIK